MKYLKSAVLFRSFSFNYKPVIITLFSAFGIIHSKQISFISSNHCPVKYYKHLKHLFYSVPNTAVTFAFSLFTRLSRKKQTNCVCSLNSDDFPLKIQKSITNFHILNFYKSEINPQRSINVSIKICVNKSHLLCLQFRTKCRQFSAK